ncbi:MAG: bifunctional 23S rRNA (guanine(2069)-N(7))-methyltransferase RlmK/23S rRNA (guanine(2445)-N(2))-methyltransferase RlmL [Candidatus Contendobacter sp.]|nr:bifunctional 23S rRNA (guanine(2069)-N(7))-methyltransferase RlmK/23S rRNA (guanine(2445)-N(2))-methyltransferase RlmL [Candidatus Contendobacter sp.]MDG4559082.1 bifunctional 23S rRNA (guanine(2069)-N(7))-methyltransferase RlmK/23S rRNA (guanine(2445)-N(2))-methyltransferase RlmL [Candidatus Contendobacter sp.]
MPEHNFIATAPAGVEPLLAAELAELGAATPRPARGGVAFQGPLELAYRACLWSRTASRVLLPLAEFPATEADALYAGIHDLPWEEHLAPDGTLSVEFSGGGPGVDHGHYGAQRIKDAIVDRFRAGCGQRPSVDARQPDLRIHARWRDGQVTVNLDLSGDSLHRRGYRAATVTAPLKETLAAALLLKAGWPAIAAVGGPLLDPLCGSGTLAIEAAWIAGDHAPGLLREHWGFSGWLGHVPALWNRLLAEARERRDAGRTRIPPIRASDRDPKAVRAASINAGRAGVADRMRIECRDWTGVEPPPGPPGLLIANPPYGERLGDQDELGALYAQLGDRLKARFVGWRAALFTGNPELGKRMGLCAVKTNVFHNGPLECRLLQFQVEPDFFVDRDASDQRARAAALARVVATGAEDFVNRLRKNLRHLERWAAREDITCYRLYDADLPEYAVAVDRYAQWLHVQEYAPPPSVDPARARERLERVMAALPAVLEIAPDRIFLKVRQRQKGASQYRKHAEQGRFHEVREGPARLLVNFTDYLDTGLFLDHRLTRRWLREQANGRRFLNLFGYTGTATVHAALGGAAHTTTVDWSATYLDWARRNLDLNGFHGPRHELIRADCRQWLIWTRDRYDLIFLDPPTFSNSKRLEVTFDVQRDHVELIRQTARLLAPDGALIFSTNARKFRLDTAALTDLRIEDWSRRTLPLDFARDPKIHQCWRLARP